MNHSSIDPTRTVFRAVLLAALAIASGCRCPEVCLAAPFPESEGSLGPTLRLVTWNVQKGLNPNLKSDLERLVATERPDLLLVQEGKADLLPGSALGGLFGKGWTYPWPRGTAFGVMSFSRVAPSSSELVPTRHRELLVTAPKETLLTRYRLVDGRSLLVANIHALCFERFGTRHFRAQLEDLRQRLSSHDGPMILCGDFNTWNPPRVAAVAAIARSLGLEELSAFPPKRTTGDRGSSFLNWLCGVDTSLPLDRIFQRGLGVESLSVLEEYRSSDHVGLAAVLRLEPRRAHFSRRVIPRSAGGLTSRARQNKNRQSEAQVSCRGQIRPQARPPGRIRKLEP